MMKPSLSFLIPAYNDAETVAAVVKDADRMGKIHASRYEILVIDDASGDGTPEVLRKLSRSNRFLNVRRHDVNRGYGATIRELYYAASMDWLFTVPGDNQISVREIEKLLPHAGEADMIIGLRVNRNDPPARLFQSRVYNGMLRFLFGLPLKDVNSVRLMNTGILKDVRLASQSAFVDAELAVRSMRAGYSVIEVPIAHRKRETNGAGGGKIGTILPVVADVMRFKLEML